MQYQKYLVCMPKPVMSGVSHSAAFDRANSSAKLLRVRICTCHWPWSQLKTHRFQCKNHRLEKANDGTGFKKPDKLTINISIIQHDTSSAKSPMNTSRSPASHLQVTACWQWPLTIEDILAVSQIRTEDYGKKQWSCHRSRTTTGYAGYIWPSWPAIPQPRMDEVDQPRRPDWNCSRWGGLVSFFSKKHSTKKEQETKKYHVIILVQLGARDFHAQSRHGLRIVDYS